MITQLRSIIVVIVLVLFSASCSRLLPNHPFMPKEKHALRVASYNVNWGRGDQETEKLHKTVATIRRLNADIVLLQETTPEWQRLIRKHLMRRYPYQSFRHYENAGGLAILTKYPFQTLHYQATSYGWHPYWIVRAQTPLGPLQVVNLHLTPPLPRKKEALFVITKLFTTAKVRLREIKDIVRHLKQRHQTIIAGDFNEGDNSQTTRYLVQHQFKDAIKNHEWATWYWRFGPILLTERFDRIFYSPDLKAVKVQALHAGGSDHFPIVVDFKKHLIWR